MPNLVRVLVIVSCLYKDFSLKKSFILIGHSLITAISASSLESRIDITLVLVSILSYVLGESLYLISGYTIYSFKALLKLILVLASPIELSSI